MEPKNMYEALEGKLGERELRELGRAFDVIGDIAVIKIPEPLLPKKHLIGEALMKVHGNLRTVLRQKGPVSGEFRTRELEVIAGEPRTETVHREHGCSFRVDLAQTYFSPRLASERLRIARLVGRDEVVVNMFAGVGCYSIVIARHGQAEKVYSIDKNPTAVEYMRHNVRINKVGACVVPVQGDAREVIKKYLKGGADRVLMPLPEFARDFLDAALLALKPNGGVIHFYDFGHEPDLFGPSLEFARKQAGGRKIELVNSRVVRSYAPKIYHVVLDLSVSAD
jgi:tRNA (guanine37-N1)-methyltransferase